MTTSQPPHDTYRVVAIERVRLYLRPSRCFLGVSIQSSEESSQRERAPSVVLQGRDIARRWKSWRRLVRLIGSPNLNDAMSLMNILLFTYFRTEHVPRRGSYPLFRNRDEAGRGLDVCAASSPSSCSSTQLTFVTFNSLRYVKSAKAATDVPTTVPEFISQRRRWLNGSFFAALHATVHFYRIWTSGHGFLRKCWLQVGYSRRLRNTALTFFFC